MPSNIEIKAKLGDSWDAAEAVAKRLADGPIHIHMHQDDVFFEVQKGRLKLRKEKMLIVDGKAVENAEGDGKNLEPGTLIAYEREDVEGPKRSNYVKTQIADSAGLIEALSRSCGVKGSVIKERKVYLVKWKKNPSIVSRVHLDKVRNLGIFIEFEVLVNEESQVKLAEEMAEYLLKEFDIQPDDLLKGAYMDLILDTTSTINAP